MVYLRFHLPVLLSSYSIVTTSYINYNLIRLWSIFILFFSQIILSSTLKLDDRVLTITKSIDEYFCRNHVQTCFFRQRHHTFFDNEQQSDNCKFVLILHSCLYHDADTKRTCEQSELNIAKLKLDKEAPRDCFTSSVYKNFYAQHLRSISPARTTVKCHITILLLFLLISFVIKIRMCC